MDADGLPLVGPGIDYTKVEAIHQKRTIAFINHFITHTASFLNRFSCVCEEKLENLSNKIQHLEISMSILESKLSSVPGLENVTVASSGTSDNSAATSTATTPAAPTPGAPAPVAADASATPPPAEEVKPHKPISQDPRYAKFFKMVQVGVPPMAVKTKMSAEGLNPDLLDNPDAPAPEGGKEDSDDDFSDKSDENSEEDDDDDDGFSD